MPKKQLTYVKILLAILLLIGFASFFGISQLNAKTASELETLETLKTESAKAKTATAAAAALPAGSAAVAIDVAALSFLQFLKDSQPTTGFSYTVRAGGDDAMFSLEGLDRARIMPQALSLKGTPFKYVDYHLIGTYSNFIDFKAFVHLLEADTRAVSRLQVEGHNFEATVTVFGTEGTKQ